MSIVLITDHDENIYDSLKQSRSYQEKSPRYVSKFHISIKQETVTKPRKSHATMGLPQRPLPVPSNYLKKNEGVHFRISATPSPKPKSHLPPVPKTVDLLEQEKNKPKRPEKNFVSDNIKWVVKMKPKKPDQKIVIDRVGFSKKMSDAMEPRYIYSSTFGKTPAYLERFLKVKTQNLQFKRDTTGLEQSKCRYVTRDERDTLLSGLKVNWEELQEQYQALPLLTDTISKKQRKSKLEADLKQLEKDIVLLERHPYIYVYDDNDPN